MYILDRSLHWSFQTHRYFGNKGMEVKRHRVVTLLPLEPAEYSPLEKAEVPSPSPTKTSRTDQVSLIVSSFGARFYIYSAFITMTIFILPTIFDLHPFFNIKISS